MLYERVKMRCSSVQPLDDVVLGSRWRICALTAGKSENDAYYPAEVLKNDFAGMKDCNSYIYRLDEGASMVFDHLPAEYLTPFDAPLMGHLIGWFSEPKIETLDGNTAITAELYIHRSAQPVRNFFLDCWEHGKEIGFSITALTAYSNRLFEGEPVHWIEKLWFISCDPVSYPAVKGARALKLLESIKKEARKEMDEKVLDSLFQIGLKIAPELKATGKNRDAGIAFCSQLMETLSVEGFPDATIKKRLSSLREALEKDNDAEAQKILALISTDFEVGRFLSASVDKLRASIETGQSTSIRKAYQLCLADMDKIDDKAMREKLLSLKTLLDGEEWEAAKEYIAGLIEMISKDMYPETGYPEPAPEETYPLPPETPPAEVPAEAAIPAYAVAAGEIVSPVIDATTAVPSVSVTPAQPAPAAVDTERKESEHKMVTVRAELPVMETPGVRVTRIELESILKGSGLPLPAQEKIKGRILNSEVSREAIQLQVAEEKTYLTSMGFLITDGQETEIEKAVRLATNEVRIAFEKEATQFKTEIAAFRESALQAQAEFKTEMGTLQESSKKTLTQEMVKRIVRESFLPAVCARRVELMFVDKVASEEEVKTAIAAEAALTSEVIASIASTVTGFGDAEPVTDEATAKNYVEKFFDARLSI